MQIVKHCPDLNFLDVDCEIHDDAGEAVVKSYHCLFSGKTPDRRWTALDCRVRINFEIRVNFLFSNSRGKLNSIDQLKSICQQI